jgi:dTDP-4-dehydrorhamnose reductase
MSGRVERQAVQSVVVLGGSGLVGSRFVELTGGRFDGLVAPSHADLDVLDEGGLSRFLAERRPDVVVNLTACADVDRAEAERGDTGGTVYRMNALLPGRLAQVCGELKTYLLHVSTDYVFDGQQDDRPYVETDAPRPLSWYAQTKHAGERAVLDSGAAASVARIEMPYSPRPHHKLDFARLCVSRLRSGTEVVGVVDQRITPVFLDDAVEALARLAEARAEGIFHLAAATWTTPYEFAHAAATALDLDTQLIVQERFERFATFRPAPRPQHSWLDVAKFEREIGPGVLRGVDESLSAWAAHILGRARR